MNLTITEGKTIEEALRKILDELQLEENEIMYKTTEKKAGLFKGTNIELSAITHQATSEFITEYLKQLITDMGIEISFESKIREGQIIIKMYSNNNPILIGKNGQTLTALQNIVRQVVYKEIGMYPNVVLDVENYKEKQVRNIERLAKNVAYEVKKTKIATKLDSMNSYDRRIVHNALSNFKGIYTESEGEEPNRCIIIKPEEE